MSVGRFGLRRFRCCILLRFTRASNGEQSSGPPRALHLRNGSGKSVPLSCFRGKPNCSGLLVYDVRRLYQMDTPFRRHSSPRRQERPKHFTGATARDASLTPTEVRTANDVTPKCGSGHGRFRIRREARSCFNKQTERRKEQARNETGHGSRERDVPHSSAEDGPKSMT